MNNDFENMVIKIIKAIDEVESTTKEEAMSKKRIVYALIKLCETEEIFNNNLLILDRESTNGLNANYQKKFKK